MALLIQMVTFRELTEIKLNFPHTIAVTVYLAFSVINRLASKTKGKNSSLITIFLFRVRWCP